MKNRAPSSQPDLAGITYRETISEPDIASIAEIVTSNGFFSAEEIEIAAELARERLAKGPQSGYHFLFADYSGAVLGYSCFGPVPLTKSGFDLYWIALLGEYRHSGIGREILKRSEKIIASMGGIVIYADTSSREQYAPTRSFYERNGYERAAYLPDFYAPSDGKIIYSKRLQCPE